MTCASCHATVPDSSRFCPACGAAQAVADAETRLGDDHTRMAAVTPSSGGGRTGVHASGWLSSSGSIDHGRFAPGTVLDGRYRITGLLGRGGMGEVFRADDLRLGQAVALKFLPKPLATDTRRLAQFHNEVRTARQVSHPNVCRVYDIGEIDGDLFLSMEYVDGEDLAASLKRIGRFPEDKALELGRQLCAGLAAAHERGVIHRDMKPANIMLDGAGKVRIMDFGLAAIGEVGDIRVGTPAYMAPEQIEGRDVTARSDIYALGLVLYEIFTGRRAFTAGTMAELLQQRSGPITSPTELVKGLDPVVERAILRCIDRDPARRPASALAVSASLPGGDPLAAALAAGETPSPEMVAAAGGESEAVSRVTGLAWLAAAGALLLLCVVLTSRVSIFAFTPVDKPPEVLADRAEQVREAFGYGDRIGDQAIGFANNGSYLSWAKKQGAGRNGWRLLESGEPPPIYFWRRTSPRLLVPVEKRGSADTEDPPLNVTGMTTVYLDTTGRLVRFIAAPPEIDPPSGNSPAAIDWSAAFRVAGLDLQTFHVATPGRTPETFADDRLAWEGLLAGADTTVHVEAAAYRGKIVSFWIVGPWTAVKRDPSYESRDNYTSPVQVIVVLVLLVGATLLARTNLRTGRADGRGSVRLAVFIFFLMMGQWALTPHVRDISEEWIRLLTGLAFAIFLAVLMWLIYLALEPFVRRNWPTMLVGWTRLLAGRVRDPIVGRELLAGVACGAALAALDLAYNLLPAWFGQPAPMPHAPQYNTLLGGREMMLTTLGALNNGLQNALLTALEFSLTRELVLRITRRLAPGGADWIPTAVAVAVITMLSAAGNDLNDWLSIVLYSVIGMSLVLLVLLRVGLLALTVMMFVSVLLQRAPLTIEGSKFYAANGWLVVGLVFALAAAGLWMARQRAAEPRRIGVQA